MRNWDTLNILYKIRGWALLCKLSNSSLDLALGFIAKVVHGADS